MVDKKGTICYSERIFAHWGIDEEVHER